MAKQVRNTAVEDYTGPSAAGVHFQKGVAEVDDDNLAALAYFDRRAGYEVGDAAPAKGETAAKAEAPAPKRETSAKE